jgi:dipeptidyl aminopeptidase/acylaminoacyl peptidase
MHQPFGTWPSPITAALVATEGVRLSAVAVDGEDLYWLEGRPAEGGRNVLVRRDATGETTDVTPPPFNVRTRVHEYGGGAFVVTDGLVCFSNFADQRLYRLRPGVAAPEPITPEGAWFYADACVDRPRNRLICVREDHTQSDREPLNAIIGVPVAANPEGSALPTRALPEILVAGYDFYSAPRLSPDGSRLAWICWNHPQMPWDGTELWMADVSPAGAVVNARRVAGGETESIYQPGWSPGGDLYFVSDRTGWWQLYRVGESVEPVLADPPASAEFGRPQWVFGTQTWACADPSRIVVSFTRDGRWHLATIDVQAGSLRQLAPALQPQDWLVATRSHAVLVAGSAHAPDAVVRLGLEDGRVERLRSSSTIEVAPACVSAPEAFTFAGADGRTAHGFYYAPRNADVLPPAGERPPLIAISHGGPTSATKATFDLRVQFWTSRGFAVVDVNYGGSSGYGREYRDRLRGQWGIVDVDDMIGAVRHLVAQDQADPERSIIRGGSAGGFTTLAALVSHPEVFTAGASYYGVSDIEVLARDTHKFEARYLDTLVGPYPAMRDEYRRRSPLHAADRLSCAIIFFQGLEDRVVPPNQSRMMADAVRRKGLPVAHLEFEGEQHGFRRAETIVACLEAELSFYGAVFGFEPADRASVTIDNLRREDRRGSRER